MPKKPTPRRFALLALLLALPLAGCSSTHDWPGHVRADREDWTYWKPYIIQHVMPALEGTAKAVAEIKMESREAFILEAEGDGE